MTVEADIFATLGPLVSNRVYPDVAPQAAALPRIVYQQVGGASVVFVDPVVADKKNGRFQIAVWGTTRLSVAALALQVETALVAAAGFDARPLGAPVSDYDDETSLYGSRQDFSIWSAR